MKKLLLVFASLLVLAGIVFAANAVSYSIVIKYDKGTLSAESVRLTEGPAPDRLVQPEEGYTLKVLSFKGEVLHSFKFAIELTPQYESLSEWFDEEGNQISVSNATLPSVETTTFAISAPYFRNAKSIDIYDTNGNLALSIDLTEFATCNMNSVCEEKESTDICPEDCPPLNEQGKLVLPLLIISLLVGIAIITKYFIKHKHREKL